MKKKFCVVGCIIVFLVILLLSLLAFNNFNRINKYKSENRNLKVKENELKETIKKYENKLNDCEQVNGVLEKTCTYIKTYEFVDYYNEIIDRASIDDNTSLIIVDNTKSLTKESPVILMFDKNKFEIDFIKNKSYEFTFKRDITYNKDTDSILMERINVIKIEPTDREGMDQINEYCIFE